VYEYNYGNFTRKAQYLNGKVVTDLRIFLILTKKGICMKNIIYHNMNSIINDIMTTVNDKNSMLSNIKIGVFIGYLLFCALGYILLLNPYVKRLNLEIIRTKSMVSIIPFEIIRQVSDIQKYVLDNVIFAN